MTDYPFPFVIGSNTGRDNGRRLATRRLPQRRRDPGCPAEPNVRRRKEGLPQDGGSAGGRGGEVPNHDSRTA